MTHEKPVVPGTSASPSGQTVKVAMRCLVAHPSHNGYSISLREFLRLLLLNAWLEGENFDGKRFFGHSGWRFDVYAGLIRAGMVEGQLDEEGYVRHVNEAEANKLIRAVIEDMAGSASAE